MCNNDKNKVEVKCILASFNESEKRQLASKIKALPGGVYISTAFYLPQCDLIICKRPTLGEKYLCGSVAEKPILSAEYIYDSHRVGYWLDKKLYELWECSNIGRCSKALINLPKRCLDYADSHNNALLFSDWRVVLCIRDNRERNAYRRLLESGGAELLPESCMRASWRVTHIFVAHDNLKTIHKSYRDHALNPQYIVDYLLNSTPIKSSKYKHDFPSDTLLHVRRTPCKSQKKSLLLCISPKQKTIVELFNQKRKTDSPLVVMEHKRLCVNEIDQSLTVVRNVSVEKDKTKLFNSHIGVKEMLDGNADKKTVDVINISSDEDNSQSSVPEELKRKNFLEAKDKDAQTDEDNVIMSIDQIDIKTENLKIDTSTGELPSTFVKDEKGLFSQPSDETEFFEFSTDSSTVCKQISNTENGVNEERKVLPSIIPKNNLVFYQRENYQGSQFIKRLPFPRCVSNMIESNLDEKNFRAAFMMAKQNISSLYYPPPIIMNALFHQLMSEENICHATELFCILHHIVGWHPVSSIPDVYITMIQHRDDNIASTSTWYAMQKIIWDLGQHLQVEACERNENVNCMFMGVEFLCSMLETNFFQVFPQGLTTCGSEKVVSTELRKVLVWRMFWGTSKECSVNSSVKEFLHLVFWLAANSVDKEQRRLLKHSLQILSLVAGCCSVKDQSLDSILCGQCCSNLKWEVKTVCNDTLSPSEVTLVAKTYFVANLKPTWLSSCLSELFLLRYNSSLVRNKGLLREPLTLTKVTGCYFFLNPKHDSTSSPKEKNCKPLASIRNIDKRNPKGETRLHVACIKNKSDQVRQLIQSGADPNIKDYAGWTPLHEAVHHGHVTCLDHLFECKELNPLVTTDDGVSVLHDAVESNQFECVRILLSVVGMRLFTLRTVSNKTAMDFVHTTQMRDLLNDFRTGSVSFNDSLYRHVVPADELEVEEYLILLRLLIRSLTSRDQINADTLRRSVDHLKQHVEKISNKMTFKLKMCIRAIGQSLNV